MSARPELENALPSLNRFITTHDSTTKKAIFSDAVNETLGWTSLPGATFALPYLTKTHPVNLTDSTDIKTYTPFLTSPPGLVASGGSVLRFVDMQPGTLSPMHRTVSLDYGVVIEGEVELVLDSGETRVLRRGDVAIQRATMHAWRNTSADKWARMVFVLLESQPIEINGEKLGEELGTMEGVPASH
ncbi:hypothetical protein C7974DRAFT_315916 [Boeremia exigua]|uniref:uncharacterized protein n=1 Tax=Boeremia exigua TaxID=749465 RepID=UPI001E8EB4C7|nr:uncharacterized protein C7974DRAFT_315916 [Boeremia exigua]KAH6620552.1 hypothetical protein C7974DRAFT_315916 [Boeremia exigua]